MTNVIAFPKCKKNTPPQTIEEILDTVESNRREHVDMFIDHAVPYIFQRAYEEGIDLSQDSCMKISSLFIESLKAALYRAYGIPHTLHEFADTAFEHVSSENSVEEDIDIISQED